MSDAPKKISSPPPPRTKSGELPAVKAFQKDIEAINEKTIPTMDAQVDRMSELYRLVTNTPSAGPDRDHTPIPGMPRTPSMIDEEELREVLRNQPTTIPEPPITVPEIDAPDSGDEEKSK